MPGTIVLKCKRWLGSVFETKKDVLAAAVTVFFILSNVLKISLFNYYLIPNADKWMLRYKLLTTLLLVVITYPILFRLKSRVLFVTFYLLQVLYILVNLSYYLYFQDYLHVQEFISNFYEGFIAVKNASGPKSPLLAVAFIDLPFFIYLSLAYFRVNRLRQRLRIFVYIAVILAVCTLGVTEYRHYKEKYFLTDIAKNMYMGESRMVQRYGTLINNAVIIYTRKSTNELINSFKYGREQTNEKEAAQKANIFIVQVESLESSIVKQKYADSFVMPYLNSLTKESVYYPYMLSYHFGGGTSDCEFSIINSVEPLERYPAIKLTTYKSPNSFISKLNQSSYTTNAFHGNEGRFYNRDLAFPKFGFNEFYDLAKMNIKEVGWGAPDAEVFKFSLEKSGEVTQPFLSYVITMTSHGPFTNASNYYNNAAYNDIKDKKVKDYFNSMSYVDDCIKNYVQSIKEEYNNAYIFIFGDHTPQIESGIYKQASMMMENKRYEFVPLFIITPDNKAYSEKRIAASFLDIAPTALYASGAEFSIKSDGANLLYPDGNVGKIPHRGSEWDREALYRKIADAMKD